VTTTTDAVTMPRETAIELLAALDAAGALFEPEIIGDDDIADYFGRLRERLTIEVFGPYSEGEDALWQSDPHIVEINARSSELQADVLDRTPAGWISPLTIGEQVARVARLREYAAEIREQGTIAVPWRVESDDAS
jgi:hypothetical protein